jgi:hypothetical protein
MQIITRINFNLENIFTLLNKILRYFSIISIKVLENDNKDADLFSIRDFDIWCFSIVHAPYIVG